MYAHVIQDPTPAGDHQAPYCGWFQGCSVLRVSQYAVVGLVRSTMACTGGPWSTATWGSATPASASYTYSGRSVEHEHLRVS